MNFVFLSVDGEKNDNIDFIFTLKITFFFVLNEKIFHLFRLPFDYKTPFGFLLVSVLQFLSAYYFVLVTVFTLAFFITSCFTWIATVDDIKADINSLNEIVKSKGNGKKLKVKLREIITFNVDIKQ